MTPSILGHPHARPLLGMACAVLAYLCYSAQDALVSLLTHSYPPLQVTAMDMSVALLLLTAIVMLRKGWHGMKAVFRTHHRGLHLLRALFFSVGTGMTFTAISKVPLSLFYVIIFVGPLLAVSFSGVVLKEPVSMQKFAAVFLGFIGLVVALRPGTEGFNVYTLLIFASACMFGANALMNRFLAPRDSALTLMYYPIAILVVMFAPWTLMHFQPMPPAPMLLTALAGVFLGLAMFFNANAFRFAPIYLIAPCQFLQFIWGTLAQYFLYGNWPSHAALFGAAMIVLSNLMILYLQYRTPRQVARP